MCVMKCLKRFGEGGRGVRGEVANPESVFGVFSPSVWRDRRFCGFNHFCAKPSASSVSGCVAGRGARASPLAIMRRSSRGALVVQGLGMRVNTLLHRLAVERFGWGCGVGTAVGSYAPS